MTHMNTGNGNEALDGTLAGLRTYDADPARVERIRARCLAQMAARSRTAAASRTGLVGHRAEPAVVCSVSLIYLAAAFAGSLALYMR